MDLTPPRKTHRLDERLLRGVPPFAKLEPRQIRAILDLAAIRSHEEGAAVFHEGAPAERFFLLLDGRVRAVRVTQTGEQVIVMHIPPGELFGVARALGKDAYPATAVAAAPSVCLSWPTRLWDRFVAEYDGFAAATYAAVGGRLGEVNERILEMATQAVEQRVASAVLRLVNQAGRKVEDGIEVDFPVTRQDLSQMAGTTLHTVSRLLSAWEREGLVSSRRRNITVTDAHALVVRSEAGR